MVKYIFIIGGVVSGLGFSSGVMIVASFTSLLLTVLETGCFLIVYTGFINSALFIHVLNMLLPHLHIVKGYEGPCECLGIIRRCYL